MWRTAICVAGREHAGKKRWCPVIHHGIHALVLALPVLGEPQRSGPVAIRANDTTPASGSLAAATAPTLSLGTLAPVGDKVKWRL